MEQAEQAQQAEPAKGKPFLTTLLLNFFLGPLGVHRFYTGYIGIGVIQLLTVGGCGIWSLIDFIFIATGRYKDIHGIELNDYNQKTGYIAIVVMIALFCLGLLNNGLPKPIPFPVPVPVQLPVSNSKAQKYECTVMQDKTPVKCTVAIAEHGNSISCDTFEPLDSKNKATDMALKDAKAGKCKQIN